MNHLIEGQVFVSSFTRKLGLAILLLLFGPGVVLAQGQPQGPPAFVTLPRHAGIENRATDSSHPVPFRLELRNEMFEMVGGLAPGGGRGNLHHPIKTRKKRIVRNGVKGVNHVIGLDVRDVSTRLKFSNQRGCRLGAGVQQNPSLRAHTPGAVNVVRL